MREGKQPRDRGRARVLGKERAQDRVGREWESVCAPEAAGWRRGGLGWGWALGSTHSTHSL